MIGQAPASEAAAIARLAGPLVIAQLSQIGMGVTDTIMAGRLGAVDLAAVALGMPLWFPVYLVCVGVLTALTPTVAQLKGARRSDEIPDAFHQAVWLAMALGLVAAPSVASLAHAPAWMDVDPAIVPVTQGYASAVAWGMPGACLFLVSRCLIEGLGDTRPTMYVQIGGLVVNGFLDYVLMFGKFGFPAMGAVGTGWATATVFWVQALLIGVYMLHLVHGPKLPIFRRFRPPRLSALIDLLRVGLPIAGGILMEVGLFAATTLLIARLGTVALAAHQVALNFASITFMVPLGIGIATSVRVGQQVGAGRADRAQVAGWAGIVMGTGFMSVAALFMFLAPGWIARLYSSETPVVELAIELLFFAALFQLFDGIQVVTAGALRGFKDTLVPMILAFLAYWVVALPIAVLLAFVLDYGPRGMWAGLGIGLLFAAGMLVARFRSFGARFTIADAPEQG